MSNKKILITGGAGFIGSNLAEALVKNGFIVTILDNFSNQVHDGKKSLNPYLSENVELIIGDITNREIFYDALLKADYVVHFAAETGTGQSMYEISNYSYVNIWGTSILCDFLVNKRHYIEKVIVASSRAIYGEGKYCCDRCGVVYPASRADDLLKIGKYEPACPVCLETESLSPLATDEQSKIHPNSIYGITKQAQEQIVLMTAKSVNLSAFALRYQNIFGPGQSLSNPYTGIISIFSALARNNQDICVFEDGNESRDFIYIDDAIIATMLCIESNLQGQYSFNVGSGERISVRTIAENIIDYLGSRSKISITGTYRKGDIRHNFADLTFIRQILNFKPEEDFTSGLHSFLDWAITQKNVSLAERYSKSIEEMKQKRLYS